MKSLSLPAHPRPSVLRTWALSVERSMLSVRRPALGAITLLSFAAAAVSAAAAAPPFNFTSGETAETTADGALRHAMGTHNIQVFRANRTASDHADGLSDTYLHQAMLAHWKGKFYLEYLSGPRSEHQAPCTTSLTTSTDGLHWEKPRLVFPAIKLPDGTETIAHQRMGFYVAPDGRLLVLCFYGKAPEPNDGHGLGRAVREIREDGTFGPIYFIRPNARPPFPNFAFPYPLYKSSPDAGFVAACDALLANKLMTAQWWEEDQLDETGFYTIKGKALSFVTRPDGSTLGVWKNALVATTTDKGRTWTEKQFGTNLPNNASKYWLQRTGDNRYALFLNPTNRLRLPLAVMTSDDCLNFSNLFAVHGEAPDQRFPGYLKNLGPQYVRGIVEGNGTPPDFSRATWIAYTVNKEDVWVSRVPTPIRGRANQPVDDSFERDQPGALPADWNVYSPAWAPVRVVETNTPAKRALELRDEDPYDYARAIRLFPETHGVKVSFKVLARQTDARLEIDVLNGRQLRPYRFALTEDGRVQGCHEGVWIDLATYKSGEWTTVSFELSKNPTSDRLDVRVNDLAAKPRNIGPTDTSATIEAISFRTGAHRPRGFGGRELPGADTKAPAASFLIDDVVITPEK